MTKVLNMKVTLDKKIRLGIIHNAKMKLRKLIYSYSYLLL